MNSQKMKLSLQVIAVLLAVSSQCGHCLKPSRVGQLIPTGTPGSVSGLAFLLNHTAIYVRDFNFNLANISGVFCAGGSTTGTSDAFTVSSSPSPFISGHSSPDVELTLPDMTTVAELAWFGVCDSTQVTSVLASVIILPQVVSNVPCETTFIGELPAGSNSLAGRVYLLNRVTFAVLGFSYDGEEIDAFFWVGAGSTPSISGYPCTYGDEIVTRLPALEDQDLVVKITPNAQGTEVTYFAIWCRSNNINLGHIPVLPGLIPGPPEPITTLPMVHLGTLSNGAHDVSGSVFALADRTLMLKDFNYDGTAPGAHFYAVRGSSVFSSNYWIIPNEVGSISPLGSYRDRTIVLTLPDDITVHTIDWFSVWCVPFSVSFAHISIPNNIALQPEVEFPTLPPIPVCPVLTSLIPVNCKQLNDDITMSWVVDNTAETIYITLCGCVLSDHYIAFGISGSDSGVLMFGGDVTWTWLDNEGVHAGDLDLSAYAQCLITQSGVDGSLSQQGACPDMQDDVTSVSGFREGCTTCIKFARPLMTSDVTDRPFLLGQEQFVIWSMGPVGSLVTPLGATIPVPFRHFIQPARSDNLRVNFSRSPMDECSLQCSDCEVTLEPWDQPVLEHNTTIICRIGQSGGERGYAGITGTAGWGISWYLNGLLIPNVTVYRGVNYTFVTEGGEDPGNPTFYHPFYITDSDRGGYLAKSLQDQELETTYAGFAAGNTPLGVGRYCEYRNIESDRSSEFTNFEEYKATLVLECDEGEAGAFWWIPDENTPDVVYFQCATHQFLGWQIQVRDPETTTPPETVATTVTTETPTTGTMGTTTPPATTVTTETPTTEPMGTTTPTGTTVTTETPTTETMGTTTPTGTTVTTETPTTETMGTTTPTGTTAVTPTDVQVPQTPVVLSVEPAGDGEVNVFIEIPSDPDFVVPQGRVTFTVTVALASSGVVVASPSTIVNNYRYGDDVTVSVPKLVIGQDYVFTVTASNAVGTSETSSETMPIEVEDTPPPKDNHDAIIGGAIGGAVGGAILFVAALAIIAFVIMKSHHSEKWYINRSSRINSMKVAMMKLPPKSDATFDPPMSQNAESEAGYEYP